MFAFSAPVILVDEILKVVGRQMNASELKKRMAKINAERGAKNK